MNVRFSLADLEDASGMSARTIRYYVQLGLIPRARGQGPSAYYTPEHVELLARINELKRQGFSLSEIHSNLRTIDERNRKHRRAKWEHITLHDDLEVQVREDAPEAVRIFLNRIEELAEEWFGEPPGSR